MFFGAYDPSAISRRSLRKAKPSNVLRLARYLKLSIDGMSVRQVIKLVFWRLTRHRSFG